MKIVGFIPYWLDYRTDHTVVDKNVNKLSGHHLINYSIKLLNSVSIINDVVIFASSPKVLEYIDDDLKYSFWRRPDFLDKENVTIEEIIGEFLKKSDADIIVLLHPNSPFLQKETVSECIEQVQSGDYDSAFTAYKYHKFAWFGGKPLNYDLEAATPKLDEIEPVILEQASLYVFTKKMFLERLKRIGENVFIKEVGYFEGHDVNEPEDFEIAELIINSGMYKAL